MTHICRDGSPGAVITSEVGALKTWACVVCGDVGSDQPCQIGKPHADATGRCRTCGKFTCDRHRSKRGQRCDTCQTRTRNTVVPPGRGPRYGSWDRTRGFSQ